MLLYMAKQSESMAEIINFRQERLAVEDITVFVRTRAVRNVMIARIARSKKILITEV